MDANEWGTVTVELTGETPLLMHNPASMEAPKTEARSTERPSASEDAERSTYRASDGSGRLILYSKHIKSTMICGAKGLRTAVGKRSLVPFIAGQVRVMPFEILLSNRQYEVDVQSVFIKGRGRILRARARVWPWSATFDLRYHRDTFQNTDILKTILDRAGMFVGLLDYRPQKFGEYGQFKVSEWQSRA